MTKSKTQSDIATATDALVPDKQVRAELAIAPMTMWRWDRNPELTALGWPPLIRIGAGRKFRSRIQLEQFKRALVRRAIAQRGGRLA